MREQTSPSLPEDSLDIVELVMAIEEAFSNQYPHLAPGDRERLIREILARIQRSGFGEKGDLDDDDLAILVRKLGPRSPHGQAGAAAQPEEPFVG
jgi:hypothetical protein